MNIASGHIEDIEIELERLIPNVDDATEEEMQTFQTGFIGLATGFTLLSKYAEYKAVAMQHRKTGFIHLALDMEAKANECYDALPHWAKW